MNDPDPEFTTLGQSVARYVSNMGGPPLSVLSGLEQRWPEIVGPALAGATRPVELVDRVLVVGCTDGAWASQVKWMERQIIENFALVLGTDGDGRSLVDSVRVKVRGAH